MKSASRIEMVECPAFDRDSEKMDPSGWWFAIRPNFRYGFIECAACHIGVVNPEAFTYAEGMKAVLRHAKEILYGRCAQDIYHKIIAKGYLDIDGATPLHEIPDILKMKLAHAAYLGKELKKAEIALVLGIKDQYQE